MKKFPPMMAITIEHKKPYRQNFPKKKILPVGLKSSTKGSNRAKKQ
jgi:hypothetical protein